MRCRPSQQVLAREMKSGTRFRTTDILYSKYMVLDPEDVGSRGVEHKVEYKGEFIDMGVLSHNEIFITLARVPGDCVNMQ